MLAGIIVHQPPSLLEQLPVAAHCKWQTAPRPGPGPGTRPHIQVEAPVPGPLATGNVPVKLNLTAAAAAAALWQPVKGAARWHKGVASAK